MYPIQAANINIFWNCNRYFEKILRKNWKNPENCREKNFLLYNNHEYIMDLENFFSPKSVAIIGASRNSKKFGHIILKNFLESDFKGRVYPINPNAEIVLGEKCYSNINDIPQAIDLAVLAIPAGLVVGTVKDCVNKRVKACLILSAGFSEVGNNDAEEQIMKLAKGKMRIIGPNVIGLYDAYTCIDTVFNLRHRQERPKKGRVAFISQSGAFGAAVLDWAASEGIGFSKFVSIGNRIDVDEVDVLEYLLNDKKTEVIAMYIEGSKRPKELYEKLKGVMKVKPVVVLKAGKTEEGIKAVMSHTGSLAGESKIYSGMLKQSGVIEANSSEELFDFVKAFSQPLPAGKTVQIVTDGGGFGIMALDFIIKHGLAPAKISVSTVNEIKSFVPAYATISNPIDLTGDATSKRYENVLNAVLNDNNVDAVIVIMLMQISALGSEVVDVLKSIKRYKKPVFVCMTGGEFTIIHKNLLEDNGIPVYPTPERAARAIKALVEYSRYLSFGVR
jgi:acetyl coenzyme A synthetase (ADP forming)-like protein